MREEEEPTSAGPRDPTTGFGDHTGPPHLQEEVIEGLTTAGLCLPPSDRPSVISTGADLEGAGSSSDITLVGDGSDPVSGALTCAQTRSSGMFKKMGSTPPAR
jgi:hypothetical protein